MGVLYDEGTIYADDEFRKQWTDQAHLSEVPLLNTHVASIDVKGNVTADTIEYANKVNADMIAIMTEQESSLSSLIMGTFAQQMLSQSTIPVLTVRPRKVLADTATY